MPKTQRKTEHHFFKWVDEAIIDEINIVDAKHSHLKEDVDSFRLCTARHLEKHAKQIEQTLHQIKMLMDAKTNTCGTEDNSASTSEDPLVSPMMSSSANSLTNIAVAAITLGTMAWIYARISN
ncbi:unnamed protein product [Eruca vesicaria subsp. sativa]|uniref:Uncharacterized protein n=1 Tax=Eruca vesicaria subsp. sativa TaxID=29727 RepID=A0ABC8KX93_ERUVS|nr:unnamed protein product [Eruca vesicaria subsp. sativa]